MQPDYAPNAFRKRPSRLLGYFVLLLPGIFPGFLFLLYEAMPYRVSMWIAPGKGVHEQMEVMRNWEDAFLRSVGMMLPIGAAILVLLLLALTHSNFRRWFSEWLPVWQVPMAIDFIILSWLFFHPIFR